ncbi:MAG: hypothetical protein A3I10_02740 [Deltaproteobacteria bacterium RIFCSPLOWO2_02_FULL_57_26]|nr:MAG: hypothetical protein A3I10_02740 [Deltaproteobacteria bacterium RIFCSPLOWO2_02_FULL_57_26]OGQ79791.1 MAG: hypothetical protein A3G40_04480 [Deltaproteobacteria bacterium RIFCSPLOWO2_12_FULL_57_22]
MWVFQELGKMDSLFPNSAKDPRTASHGGPNITEEIRFSTLKGLNPILLFSIRAILREKATRA